MKKWKITIKEVGNPHEIVTYYYGRVDYDYVKEFFGLEQPDVEWFRIEGEIL